MGKYRKKPVIVDAFQWFANGDHPDDGDETYVSPLDGETYRCEGKVVRRFRRPDVSGRTACSKCGNVMHDHGWIDTLESGHVVCPGDFIITGVDGERYPCKTSIFLKTYEHVSGPHGGSSG